MVLDAVAAIGFAPRSALTKIQDPLNRSSLCPSAAGHPGLATYQCVRHPTTRLPTYLSISCLRMGKISSGRAFIAHHVTRVVLLPVC